MRASHRRAPCAAEWIRPGCSCRTPLIGPLSSSALSTASIGRRSKFTSCASGSFTRTPSRKTLTPCGAPTTGERVKPRMSNDGCAWLPWSFDALTPGMRSSTSVALRPLAAGVSTICSRRTGSRRSTDGASRAPETTMRCSCCALVESVPVVSRCATWAPSERAGAGHEHEGEDERPPHQRNMSSRASRGDACSPLPFRVARASFSGVNATHRTE